MDGPFVVMSYRVKSSDMADVALKLEQLEISGEENKHRTPQKNDAAAAIPRTRTLAGAVSVYKGTHPQAMAPAEACRGFPSEKVVVVTDTDVVATTNAASRSPPGSLKRLEKIALNGSAGWR